MDTRLKYLFVSFVLGLTDEQEDAKVIAMIKHKPYILTILFTIEKQIFRYAEKRSFKSGNKNIFRAKLDKFHII
jgi:hypothetical protein